MQDSLMVHFNRIKGQNIFIQYNKIIGNGVNFPKCQWPISKSHKLFNFHTNWRKIQWPISQSHKNFKISHEFLNIGHILSQKWQEYQQWSKSQQQLKRLHLP